MVTMESIYEKFGFISASEVFRCADKDTQHYIAGYYHGANNTQLNLATHSLMWQMGHEDARGDLGNE